MRCIGTFGTVVALLSLGGGASVHAQQSQDPNTTRREPHDQRQPAQQHAPSGLQSREPEAERRPVRPEEQREMWRQHRARSWQFEHHSWQQRGGYRWFHIPDDRFRDHFGPNHSFRIYLLPMVMVGRSPRFQYNGFWFRLVDPWPEDWSDDWYRDDDVYIDYADDGYYLCNRSHPGIRLALMVYAE
jgi:hypothetical protein